MPPDSATPTDSQSIKDITVTLPGWGLWVIASLCLFSLVLAIALVLLSSSDNVKGYAVQLLIVLVPLGSAIIVGIAIRRTSTRQIDILVTGFLEKTVLERFQINCRSSQILSSRTYPFNAVKLLEPCRGTSYVRYELSWRLWCNQVRHPPAQIGIKCNVFNFELFSELPVQIDSNTNVTNLADEIIDNTIDVTRLTAHPVLSHFMRVLQGSINEGYEAHVSFRPQQTRPNSWLMHFSLRQKLGVNFLTSPFLKRYFAEDAAIAAGVLYEEWLAFQPAETTVAEAR